MELKKSLRRANVWIAMGLGILLSVLHAIWVSNKLEISFLQRIRENGKNAYFIATPSFMQGWIGMDVFSVYGSLFYLVLFPMLAALPYAASLLRERQLGYDKQAIIRSGRRRYYFAKYISVFLTSGIVVTIPSLISLGIAMTYLPMIPVTAFMYQTGVTDLWVSIFYSKPLLYAFLYILLDFVIAGTLGIVSLALSWRIENTFMILVLPMMMNLMLVEVLSSAPGFLGELSKYVPYSYIHPGQVRFYSGWNVAIGVAVLFVVSSGYYWYQVYRQDVLS
jgi:hypothetical protein